VKVRWRFVIVDLMLRWTRMSYLRDQYARTTPDHPHGRRYVAGQQIYLRTCEPGRYASVIINNEALDSPFVVAR
jgi:hypothetical protein